MSPLQSRSTLSAASALPSRGTSPFGLTVTENGEQPDCSVASRLESSLAASLSGRSSVAGPRSVVDPG